MDNKTYLDVSKLLRRRLSNEKEPRADEGSVIVSSIFFGNPRVANRAIDKKIVSLSTSCFQEVKIRSDLE